MLPTRPGAGLPVVLTAALMLTAAAWAGENVARERPFVCSTDILEGWTGLVDGVVDSDSAPGCFATSNDNQFPKYVTIDLQQPHKINRIAVHNSANGNTRGIIISCSLDGQHYEQLREFIFPQGEPITLNHRFNDRPAQFVRVEFTNTWGGGLGGDNTIFIREVEVFGSPTGGAPALRPLPEPRGEALVETRDLRLFRRWAIGSEGPLKVAVLGDSFAACDEETWPQEVAERLEHARPDGAEITLASMGEEGLTPRAATGRMETLAEMRPDLVLITFGTDLERWDQGEFRAGLTRLLQRLLNETDALLVLVGPAVTETERVDIGRRALDEMERVGNLLSVPMLRTEVALSGEGLSADEFRNEDGGLTEETRRVIATSMLELLLQP